LELGNKNIVQDFGTGHYLPFIYRYPPNWQIG